MTPKQLIERERCRRDAHYFIFEAGVLYSKDEHSVNNPVRLFPNLLYLRVLLDCLLVSGRFLKPNEPHFAKEACSPEYLEAIHKMGMFLVEKSRQVMATWITCAYILWRAKFHDYQLILVQSKREDDAASLVFNKDPTVSRMSFMEIGLPEHLRSIEFPKGATFGHLYFPNGSHVWAIPEGGDVIRSNSPSLIFMDEAAFMPEFGAAYAAARPAVEGGGQLACVSSAEPGDYAELIQAM